MSLEINRPEIVAEITQAFERYESALMANDVATLSLGRTVVPPSNG